MTSALHAFPQMTSALASAVILTRGAHHLTPAPFPHSVRSSLFIRRSSDPSCESNRRGWDSSSALPFLPEPRSRPAHLRSSFALPPIRSALAGFESLLCIRAERVGFEPTERFPVHTLSRRTPSSTRTPLQQTILSFLLFSIYGKIHSSRFRDILSRPGILAQNDIEQFLYIAYVIYPTYFQACPL